MPGSAFFGEGGGFYPYGQGDLAPRKRVSWKNGHREESWWMNGRQVAAPDDLAEQFPGFEGKNHSVDISQQQAAPPNNGPTPDSYASVVPALIKTLQQNHPDLPIWRDSIQLKGLSDDLRNRFTPKSPMGDLQRLRQSSNNSPSHGPRSVRQGDPDLEYLDGQQGAEAWKQQTKL